LREGLNHLFEIGRRTGVGSAIAGGVIGNRRRRDRQSPAARSAIAGGAIGNRR
jgi:hypothetical protein